MFGAPPGLFTPEEEKSVTFDDTSTVISEVGYTYVSTITHVLRPLCNYYRDHLSQQRKKMVAVYSITKMKKVDCLALAPRRRALLVT